MRAPSRVTLRCVLFHHIADRDSTFTTGLGVRIGVDEFRSRIARLARRYQPVSLADVRAAVEGEDLPRRAMLVTFDDAYASVSEHAASILEEFRVPSVFFVNGGLIDHRELNIDNLVAHTVAVAGEAALPRAVARVRPDMDGATLPRVLGELLPTLPLAEVDALRDALTGQLDHDPNARARDEGLYLTAAMLRSLPASMAIGSHTRSHVRCRVLDADELVTQIDGNRRLLADLVDGPVDAFSVPYGSAADFPRRVETAVEAAGHDLSFLVEGRLNHGALAPRRIVRVSQATGSPTWSLLQIEVLPRLRRARDLVREIGS